MKKHRQASLQRDAFLFCLSQTGNFTIAAEFAGLSSSALRHQADTDSQFASAINEAFREACDRLFYVAFERAIKGIVILQFYQGEEVGAIRRPSDALLRYLKQISSLPFIFLIYGLLIGRAIPPLCRWRSYQWLLTLVPRAFLVL